MGKTATWSDSDTMSVASARAILGNTRGVSDTVVEEAQQTIRAMHLENVGRGMCKCGSACWVPGEFGLVCERCGSPSAAATEAAAAAAAEKRAAQKAKEAASAPQPRAALQAVVTELAGARAEEAKLETAAVNARDQLARARVALDVAEAALPLACSRAAEANVEALLMGKTKPPKTVAAEAAAVSLAGEGLEAARVAAQTIEDRLADARANTARLEKQHRLAALAVLADECAPLLVARANEARQEFVAASRGLQWLEAAGVAPSSLIAAELRWSWNRLPDTWTTGSQPGPDLDAALSALLRDPRAPGGEWA